MIRPRNTFVVVKLIEQAERKVGSITVPTNQDQYCEAIVAAVGPGNIAASGGRSDTFDLSEGDRILVKHQDVKQMGQALHKVKTGTEYLDGEDKYTIFEQMSIIAIVEKVKALPAEVPLPRAEPYRTAVRSRDCVSGKTLSI